MHATTFDTLGYFESLTAAGVEETQAKAHISVIRSAIFANDENTRSQLATKGDMADIKGDVADIRGDIAVLHVELAHMKHEILKWVMGMMVAQTGVIAALYAIMR